MGRTPLIVVLNVDDPNIAGKAASQGHHVCVPLGREAEPEAQAAELPRLARPPFVEAVQNMGFSEETFGTPQLGGAVLAFPRKRSMYRGEGSGVQDVRECPPKYRQFCILR